MSKALRHFLDLNEIPTKELRNMLASSVAMKAKLKGRGKPRNRSTGKTLAMIFEKPSTRTRVSFDVGMRQLGGESIMLTARKCSPAAAKPSPTPPGCCRAMSTPS